MQRLKCPCFKCSKWILKNSPQYYFLSSTFIHCRSHPLIIFLWFFIIITIFFNFLFCRSLSKCTGIFALHFVFLRHPLWIFFFFWYTLYRLVFGFIPGHPASIFIHFDSIHLNSSIFIHVCSRSIYVGIIFLFYWILIFYNV